MAAMPSTSAQLSALPTEDLLIIQGREQAVALLHPERSRLLGGLAEPRSASGLARYLGLPRQRVNYHIRTLEAAGLVHLVAERRVGNCMERVVQRSARSYLISPEVLGALGGGPETVRDRFSSSFLVAALARGIRDVALLRGLADRVRKRFATFSLQTEVGFASARERAAFLDDLGNAVVSLAAQYPVDLAGKRRKFRLLLGFHPTPPAMESPRAE